MNNGISLIKVTAFPYFLFSQWLEMAGTENGSVKKNRIKLKTRDLSKYRFLQS